MSITRRAALQGLGAAGAATLALGRTDQADAAEIQVGGQPVEVAVTPVGANVVRITVARVEGGKAIPITDGGSLVPRTWEAPALRISSPGEPHTVACGEVRVTVSSQPLTIRVEAPDGRPIRTLRIDESTGAVAFSLGDGHVYGLGEGGPQFDRRGAVERMRSGQGGYRLRTHGGRVPVPWLIGTSGWALFVNQPTGSFDLTGPEGRFTPGTQASALPIDLFVVTAREPEQVMASYAHLTGLPELPPLWSLGYQQSHRTLASREEVMGVARSFREKKLPCDTLIYLGTGFCPSGWNTGHGSFTFNPKAFPDPQAMIDELHAQHFHVIPHVVILAKSLRGSVGDPPDPSRPADEDVPRYWDTHRKVFGLGVDGWWPDEGDPLDAASRLDRNRMYWEGCQLDRPNQRPFALHRNGRAGMQRYAAFLWSGDVYSTWETLRVHVPIAVNTGLSGIPYWGTDIGGFVPTKEFTGELYVRWFQFGAFCPLFRSHGRTWKLRLPWGWDTGELGPDETRNYGDAGNPGPDELHNSAVEPICRQYLELRYKLLPYLYSVVRDGHVSGLPILRALWLYYPDDPTASARGDEFLWGRDLLVAPVTEKGASTRSLYLPRGTWHDYWTEEPVEGGREIQRPVDLATVPLYVRAGAILPTDPVRQSTEEPLDGPRTLTIYPGADGHFTLYDDDGKSFAYRQGDWQGIDLTWHDADRRLTLRLAEGSKFLPALNRPLSARLAPGKETRAITFAGEPIEVRW